MRVFRLSLFTGLLALGLGLFDLGWRLSTNGGSVDLVIGVCDGFAIGASLTALAFHRLAVRRDGP